MKPLLLAIFMLFLTVHASAQDFDKVIEIIAEVETNEMHEELITWTDQKLANSLSNVILTENDMKKLYRQFKNTIVDPPDPDTYTEYSIENAEESLGQTERLGKKVHNMLFGLPSESIEKYGKLLHAMRDVFYIDWKHIPLAIKHDNSRDVYWFQLHTKWLKRVEEEYQRLMVELDTEQ